MAWFKPAYVPAVVLEEIKIEGTPNFDEFSEEFELEFHKNLKKIAYETKDLWMSEAGKRLKRSREAYQRSLTVQNPGEGQYSVVLGGPGGRASRQDKWLALAVEQGIPNMWDMKPGLLKGRESRVIPLNTLDKGRIFRTVKAHGQEGKWIYPGLIGINLRDTVIIEANLTIIPKYVDDAYQKALKKL